VHSPAIDFYQEVCENKEFLVTLTYLVTRY